MVSCVTKCNDSILLESLSVQLSNSLYRMLSSAGEQLEALTVGEGKRQTRGGTSVTVVGCAVSVIASLTPRRWKGDEEEQEEGNLGMPLPVTTLVTWSALGNVLAG